MKNYSNAFCILNGEQNEETIETKGRCTVACFTHGVLPSISSVYRALPLHLWPTVEQLASQIESKSMKLPFGKLKNSKRGVL